MQEHKIHIYKETVRFEDVDMGGIVYHPVFLTYLERARSQSLIDRGIGIRRFIEEGFGFVVSAVQMKYIRPLRLQDAIFIGSQVDERQQSIVNMTQAIASDPADLAVKNLKSDLRQIKSLCFYAHLKLCVISLATGRPTAPPDWSEPHWII